MLRTAVICGSHNRNIGLLDAALRNNKLNVVGAIIFHRENEEPSPPANISNYLKSLWKTHFHKRLVAERNYFNFDLKSLLKEIETIFVSTQTELSSNTTCDFINSLNLDLVLITGVPIIKEPLLSSLPTYSVNLHLGLIPDYKGAITMFWPFYMLEPTMAGCTYHIINKYVDTGKIIHQVTPTLNIGDGMHDVACKSSIKSFEEFNRVCEWLIENIQKGIKPIFDDDLMRKGHLFLKRDFTAEKLRVNYELFEDKMVDAVIKGQLYCRKPKLIRI